MNPSTRDELRERIARTLYEIDLDPDDAQWDEVPNLRAVHRSEADAVLDALDLQRVTVVYNVRGVPSTTHGPDDRLVSLADVPVFTAGVLSPDPAAASGGST